MKRRIIVYGLGKRFKDQRRMLECMFKIVGYCDKAPHDIDLFISPEEIKSIDYDAIYITSTKYYQEIKESLSREYGVSEDRIVTLQELTGLVEGSEERKKWVIEQLSNIEPGKTLLDAGAGEMQFKPFCSHLRYIAQDFGQYDPQKEPGGLKGGSKWDTTKCNIISDIIDIPLENQSVDAILCTEVFEHLKNPMLAVKEFNRLLKPGGILILTAPFCSLTHMAPYYFYNGFSEYWYQTVLSENGFEIETIDKNSNLFMYFAWWLFKLESVTRQYSTSMMSDAEIQNVVMVINTLVKIGANETDSSETLCFGHNVIARKQGYDVTN